MSICQIAHLGPGGHEALPGGHPPKRHLGQQLQVLLERPLRPGRLAAVVHQDDFVQELRRGPVQHRGYRPQQR